MADQRSRVGLDPPGDERCSVNWVPNEEDLNAIAEMQSRHAAPSSQNDWLVWVITFSGLTVWFTCSTVVAGGIRLERLHFLLALLNLAIVWAIMHLVGRYLSERALRRNWVSHLVRL
jgi:membrane protein YqaA with SNARE-associated domain